jgi:hypothetical protein
MRTGLGDYLTFWSQRELLEIKLEKFSEMNRDFLFVK